jgi:phage terminase large subunit
MVLDVSDLGLWNEVYLPLMDAERDAFDINTLWGSGGSGKSQYIFRRWITKMFEKRRRRYYVIRKVNATLRTSSYQDLKDCVYDWGVEKYFKFTVNPLRIQGPNGNEVVFLGCDDPEKLKSLAAGDEVFCEEVTELDKTDFLQIMIRVRGQGKDGDRKIIWAAFNPVDEDHWVKTTLVDPAVHWNTTTTANASTGNIRAVHTTYLDNKFVGDAYAQKMEYIRALDFNYYRIYALGQWGITRPDAPFFHKFDEEAHVSAHFQKYSEWPRYNPDKAIYVSFDFNIINSAIVSQKHWEAGYFPYLQEYHEAGGFDLDAVVDEILDTYTDSYVMVTGDPAGNAGSALTKDNASGFDIIRSRFAARGQGWRCNMDNVASASLGYRTSKLISNAVLHHEKGNLFFHPEMKRTISDMKKMRQGKEGGLDKKHCDDHDYGHLGDCVRYDTAFHMEDHFKSYGYDFLKAG